MISLFQHKLSGRKWLSYLLLLVFLCNQCIALAHDHDHDHETAHTDNGAITATEHSCAACATTDHSPATDSTGSVLPFQKSSAEVASTALSIVLIDLDELYFARAPPISLQALDPVS
ncbi:MAG: hypothetical protein CMP86_10280 [Gammaproteobacteria bacterium]|nr:hypothetical protein [Gammaproteobacteria bacterium]